jgi:kynurenine 3-monooxygenase
MRAATSKHNDIVVVGAGMGGCLMSMLLGRAGFHVGVYERAEDLRANLKAAGRSINLTIAARAIEAMERLGIADSILSQTVPLRGRMIHRANGQRRFQPYGDHPTEVLYSIRRNHLNAALVDHVARTPNVDLQFHAGCVGLDKNAAIGRFEDTRTHERFDVGSRLVIGADGAFSTVRRHMHIGERAEHHQEFLDWGYREMEICPHEASRAGLELDVLHIWPRGSCLFLAMPNIDGSFTCTLVLPFEGKVSFDALKTHEDVTRFFATELPDAAPLFPTLCEDFFEHPEAGFLMVETAPWHYRDKVVLLGDACHTVLPFYGQGMNAAFEDCLSLLECINDDPAHWEQRFRGYQDERKRNTDALAELSRQNFLELKDSLRSPLVGMRARTNLFLSRHVAGWTPLYTLISHSTVPYADAVAQVHRQDRILRWTGVDLALRTAARTVVAANKLRALAGTVTAGWRTATVARPALERAAAVRPIAREAMRDFVPATPDAAASVAGTPAPAPAQALRKASGSR